MLNFQNSNLKSTRLNESKDDIINLVDKFIQDHGIAATIENNSFMVDEIIEIPDFTPVFKNDIVYEHNKLVIFLTKLNEKWVRFKALSER